MEVDLTGGLDPAHEYLHTEYQTAKGLQEGMNWWLWDDAGQFCMPRFAVECTTPDWDHPEIQLGFARADGKLLLRNLSKAPVHKKLDAAGNASHLGAGPLWFDCIEPFRRYSVEFQGNAIAGTFEEMLAPAFTSDERGVYAMAAGRDSPPLSIAALQFAIEAKAVVPPWVQGSMSDDAHERMKAGAEAEFVGGQRLEQLMRVKGTINYNGTTQEFTGGALRIRRTGIRNITGFWGHCWQSAVFPSGRAFGYIAFPPRADNSSSYNEGYVFLGEGSLIPARVVEAPWLRHYQFSGEDVGFVMETLDGRRFAIKGTSFGGVPSVAAAGSAMPSLFQSVAHYEWDNEKAYGMMERSNLPENITGPT